MVALMQLSFLHTHILSSPFNNLILNHFWQRMEFGISLAIAKPEVVMKVAIAVWENSISPFFDTTNHILFAEIINRLITKKEKICLDGISHFQRAEVLQKLQTDLFICGGISQLLLDRIRGKNIRSIPNICGDIDEILQAICSGADIESRFSMPGKRNLEGE